LLSTMQAVMPSFVARVDRPERGGEWVEYLQRRESAARSWVARLGLDREPGDDGHGGPSVTLLHVDGDEDGLLASLLFDAAGVSERQTLERVAQLGVVERAALLGDLVGERSN